MWLVLRRFFSKRESLIGVFADHPRTASRGKEAETYCSSIEKHGQKETYLCILISIIASYLLFH